MPCSICGCDKEDLIHHRRVLEAREDAAGMGHEISKSCHEFKMDETEAQELRRKQAEADRAWGFLEEKCVANLDIERAGKHKVTLTELLVEFGERAMAGIRSQLAQSSNYFADDEIFPRKVTFANGRTVAIADRPEGAFLVVGKLPPKGTENV